MRLGLRRMDWLSVTERDWRKRGEKERWRTLEVILGAVATVFVNVATERNRENIG